MGVDAQPDLVSEIARLKVAIDDAAAVAQNSLAGRQSASVDDAARAEHEELSRQLGALRDRVARAEHRDEGAAALRAELATLVFFAGALRADAEHWRSARRDEAEALERRLVAAREERERLVAEDVAEHEKLVRSRDALQSTILQTAARVARQYRGEWRRTIPVFTLGDGLTVCSVTVSCPRRGLRLARQWVVTLTGSHDVQIRRE